MVEFCFRHDPELYVKPKGPVSPVSPQNFNARPTPDDLKAKSESTLFHKKERPNPGGAPTPVSPGYPARSQPNLEGSGLEPDDQKIRNYENSNRMRLVYFELLN